MTVPRRDRITLTPRSDWAAGHVQVEVNGHDISRAVRAVEVEFDADELLPRVRLELAVMEVDRLDLLEAELVIPSGTRDALIVLGWIPPKVTPRPPNETAEREGLNR